MAERIQKPKNTSSTTAPATDQAAPAITETGDKIKADIDDLLDEIDDVLETNAEDFVKSYVQKGGQ
jgi:ubiquitin-like protein Pup